MPRRKKAPKPPHYRKVSLELYQRMWEAYQVKQSVQHVARATGVAWITASRYVEEGDDSRGLKPLRDRFAKIMQNAQRYEDYNLALARADTLKLVRAYKVRLAERVKRIQQEDMSASIAVEIDRCARLEEDLLGKAPPDNRKVEALFEGWTDQELEEYAMTGRWPARKEGTVRLPVEPEKGGPDEGDGEEDAG